MYTTTVVLQKYNVQNHVDIIERELILELERERELLAYLYYDLKDIAKIENRIKICRNLIVL